MKFAIFGLAVSSSWGNGHATLWRGLCSALGKRGHTVVFFERDVPCYAAARDLTTLPGGGELILYQDWESVCSAAARHANEADVAIVTSFCPDAAAASRLAIESKAEMAVFYDLDSPVTLAELAAGRAVPWVGPDGYSNFDLLLSYAGGAALKSLKELLGATRVAPLYGSADPAVHRPVNETRFPFSHASYMGTYAPDRDDSLRNLFLEPARRMPDRRFLLGGSQYDGFDWLPNIFYAGHVAPHEHPAFYCAGRLTVNVTRAPMAATGYCPSARIFEASACGVPVMTDWWEGVDRFFDTDSEILVCRDTADAMRALSLHQEQLAQVGRRARERTLAHHTPLHRAIELERILEDASSGRDWQKTAAAYGE
jgi:spore maturation protein CgeB